MGELKVLVGVPCGKQPVCNDFYNAYERLITPPGSTKQQVVGGSVPQNLNALVDCAIEDKATHLFIVEDDSKFEPDALMRLLAHDVPVVTGLCRERHPPFRPFLYESLGDEGFKMRGLQPEDKGLIKVDATGMGGILINMDVFAKLSRPYFHHYFVGEKEWGQDIVFGASLVKAGIPVYCDLDVVIGHITQCVISTLPGSDGWHCAVGIGTAMIDLKSWGNM